MLVVGSKLRPGNIKNKTGNQSMILTLDGLHEIKYPSDFAPIVKERPRETYPVFVDPKSGEIYTCIAWAMNMLNGYEYYAFGIAKGSMKRPKCIVYQGFKMEETSFFGEFSRRDITTYDFEFEDNADILGRAVIAPEYHNRGSEDYLPWERLPIPFF